MKIGTKQAKQVCDLLGIEWPKALGIELTFIKQRYSRPQENLHWACINEWLANDKGLSCTPEDLHDYCLRYHFGQFEYTYPNNDIGYKPVRTTTTVYDQDQRKYVKKKLDPESYSEYMEFVFKMAAERGVILESQNGK